MRGGQGLLIGTVTSWLLIFIVVGGFWGCPNYRVWQQEMAGKAELKRAEQNRQIRILEAKAKKESALYEMEAEITRARGAAEANLIIDSSLTEQYLRYLWTQGLNDGKSEVIYVPTEANLPILEANRHLMKRRNNED